MLRTKLPFFLSYARANNQPIFIDYIESDGNQYIDTGIIQSPNQKFEIVTQPLTLAGNQAFFGVQHAYGAKYMYLGIYASYPGWLAQYGNGSNYFNYGTKDLNKHTFVLDLPNLTLNVDDVSYDISAHSTAISGAYSVWLFARNDRGNGRTPYTGRVYDYKAYENGELVQHLKPCLHPETFEACMYDTVTKQYFYNKGTGSFIAGPRFIEYIKSTGTQYIDTGVYAPGITRFVVKGTCDKNLSSNTQLLGTNINSATTFFGARYMSATGAKSWYCINAEGVSIGNPTDLSIIDCTIESRTSQYGTLIDLVNNTTSEFTRFASGEWGFTSGNLILFGGEFARRSPNATCYSLQLYTANGLVRDLRPCLDGNNVKCMYDLITGKYYYNQGTGEFE